MDSSLTPNQPQQQALYGATQPPQLQYLPYPPVMPMSDLVYRDLLHKEHSARRTQRLKHLSKFLFFVGGLALIGLSLLRCFVFATVQSPHEFLISGLFMLFGLLVCASQLNVEWIQKNFRFLAYYWGKSAFSLFLASISFTSRQEAFQQWILMMYFTGIAVCFGVLACVDSQRDAEEEESTLKKMHELSKDMDDTDYERYPLMIDSLRDGLKDSIHKLDGLVQGTEYGSIPTGAKETEDQKIQRVHLKHQLHQDNFVKEANNSSF